MNQVKQETITHTKKKFRWVIAVLIFLVYSVAAADRANLGVVLPFIREDFHMSNTEAGALSSLFLLAYGLFQIPSGFLYSKLGVRKIFSISMILTSICTGFIGFSSSVLGLKISRFVLGIAEAPLPVGITSTINHWFPAKEKGLVTAIFLSAAKFGPVLVPPLCTFIIYHYNWHYVFYFFAIPGIFLSVIWFFVVTNKPSESKFCSSEELNYIENEEPFNKKVTNGSQKSVTKTEFDLLDKFIRTKEINLISNKRKVFLSWNLWGCALGYFFMLGIVNVLLAWIPTYLIEERGFSIIKMGFIAMAPWVGAIIGNILGGTISDRVVNKRRKPMMIVSALATVIMMFVLINAPDNAFLLGLLLLLTGILLNLGFSAYMVYPMGLANKEVFPLACSLINTWGQLGGAFAPLMAGYLLDNYNWNYVFMFLAGSSFVSLIALFTIIEPMKKRS